MKTSIKILWVGLILIFLTGMTFITFTRLDLHEIIPEDGNGIVIEKMIPMEEFAGFTAYDGIKIHYLPGERYEAKVKTDSNLIKHLSFDFYHGEWLHIETKNEFGNPTQLEVTVYAPQIIGFNAYNSAEVICDSAFNQPKLEVRTENSGKVSFFAITGELTLRARNSSDILVRGQTEDLNVEVNNSSKIDAIDLLSQFAEVRANGSGKVKLTVEKRLVSNSRAGSTVRYSGPENLVIKASGKGATLPIRDMESQKKNQEATPSP